ncbi:MAG TPA: hypothetical protein VLH56_13955 [Dissulfurispiraceae bacterium]|nr:hypothetical protein [Dissulfurispiraceae bacterium]
MKRLSSSQELYHEIFGSILDRAEMTPYLLLPADNYQTALRQAAQMMRNRGFDTTGADELLDSEKLRALRYVEQAYRYFFDWMFPFVRNQLEALLHLKSPNTKPYLACRQAVTEMETTLAASAFRDLVLEDPRHLFLLASSRKYPHVFHGYKGAGMEIPPAWQQGGCTLLKMSHLIKSIEEDSQDINDYAQLGLFLAGQGLSLNDLYQYDWLHPEHLPESESAQRAFVKLSAFFHKLKESMVHDTGKGCLVFNSGDGVRVCIVDIKARLKSPESMFTKLGKDVEGEAWDIRDILAITFLLKSKDDTLKLFHALQKRGVILQENTVSHSITQTLFDTPESMVEATRRLMLSLAQSEGKDTAADETEIIANAAKFFDSLNVHAEKNRFSSLGHRKFQCKIAFSLPIHRTADTNQIIIPGTPAYGKRNQISKKTQQHTLGIELRISDEESWHASEQRGESHHDAYKFRQLVAVMNRIFKGVFHLPKEHFAQLRKDQGKLFS